MGIIKKELMEDKIVAGVDIGGSHITTALVNLSGKTIYGHTISRQAVNAHGKVEEIIHCWCNSLRNSFQLHHMATGKVGIAIPGPFDYANGISLIQNQDKYDSLYQQNVKQLIAAELGIPPSHIRLKNDAVCFLQGEVFSGAAADYSHALGLTLGTGLGSALYQNGDVTDANRWCSPFRASIAEDYISSRWFVTRFRQLTGKRRENVKQLADLLPQNAQVQLLFAEFGENLADFILQNYSDAVPEVVVLGGNIAHTMDWFLPTLTSRLSENGMQCAIVKAVHNEHAALVGAAACWSDVLTSQGRANPKRNNEVILY